MEDKENRPQDEQGAVVHRGSRSVELIEVIEVKTCVGKGTAVDPNRIITEYWSKAGSLLAVTDPITTESAATMEKNSKNK